MRKMWMVLGLGLSLTASGAARADVWDVQTSNDNSPAGTQNELVHGGDQIHDLGALAGGALPDEDWYRIGQKGYASYEVTVDATSGDIGAGVLLQRFASDGATVLQTAAPVTAGLNYSQSLRWMNGAAEVDDQYVRVVSGGCTTDCGPDDVYRLRSFETTQSIPRFNNVGSQITILLLQNPSGYSITGNVYFWSTNGSLLAPFPFSLQAKNTLVLNTATVVNGSGGAINDGRYGDLTGKTVALEPSTGFSFDSPMVPRVN
jgi:hypothetical protein